MVEQSGLGLVLPSPNPQRCLAPQKLHGEAGPPPAGDRNALSCAVPGAQGGAASASHGVGTGCEGWLFGLGLLSRGRGGMFSCGGPARVCTYEGADSQCTASAPAGPSEPGPPKNKFMLIGEVRLCSHHIHREDQQDIRRFCAGRSHFGSLSKHTYIDSILPLPRGPLHRCFGDGRYGSSAECLGSVAGAGLSWLQFASGGIAGTA